MFQLTSKDFFFYFLTQTYVGISDGIKEVKNDAEIFGRMQHDMYETSTLSMPFPKRMPNADAVKKNI